MTITAATGGIGLIGSSVEARTGDATLAAKEGVLLATATDRDSRFEKDEKGGFFNAKGREETHATTTEVGSAVTSGRDLTIRSSDEDITLKSAALEAETVDLDAAKGRVNLLTSKDTRFDQTKTHGSNMVWQTARDTGESAETIHHTTIKTDHLTVTAGKGIVAEVETKGELRQSLEALSSQPGMAWVSELRGRDDVNWTQVQAYYDHWDHKSQGLTRTIHQAAAIIAIAVTIATSGTGAGTGLALGVENTALAAGIDAAASAGIGSLATAATISMINNQGNIGAVLKDLGSSENVRSLLVSMASAAAFSGVGSLTDGHFAADGRTLERGLTPSQYMQTVEYVQNIAGHAAVGCAAALASGQSCGSGAAAAALSGAAGPLYIGAGTIGGTVLASATGGLGAGLTGGDIAQGMTTGAMGYLFNDILTGTVTFQFPDWSRRAVNLVFGTDYLATGGTVGLALSWPGPFGGSWDMGVLGQGTLAGADASSGIGFVGLELGYGVGSVRNLDDLGLQTSFNDGVGGLTINGSIDAHGMFSAPGSTVGIHLGPGFQFQVAPTMTGTITVRDAIDYIRTRYM